jgi:hypothetical protein
MPRCIPLDPPVSVCVSVLKLQVAGLGGLTALLLSAGAREGKGTGRSRAFLCPRAAPAAPVAPAPLVDTR